MLQLGQRVRIGEEPNYGYSYFDSGHLDTIDWIVGVRKVEADCYTYQLKGEDEDCWWLEDELYDYETVIAPSDTTPLYDIDDRVIELDEPQEVKTITAVIEYDNEYLYELDDEGAYVGEYDIVIYSKKGTDVPNYTLF